VAGEIFSLEGIFSPEVRNRRPPPHIPIPPKIFMSGVEFRKFDPLLRKIWLSDFVTYPIGREYHHYNPRKFHIKRPTQFEWAGLEHVENRLDWHYKNFQTLVKQVIFDEFSLFFETWWSGWVGSNPSFLDGKKRIQFEFSPFLHFHSPLNVSWTPKDSELKFTWEMSQCR